MSIQQMVQVCTGQTPTLESAAQNDGCGPTCSVTQAQQLVWSGTTRAGTACHQEKAKRVNQGMILAGKP